MYEIVFETRSIPGSTNNKMYKAFLVLNSLSFILSQNCTVDIIYPEKSQRNGSHANLLSKSLTFYSNINLTGVNVSLNLTDNQCFNTNFAPYALVDVGYNCFEAYSEDNCFGTMWYFVPARLRIGSFKMKSVIPCRFDAQDVDSEEYNKINSSYDASSAVIKPEIYFFKSLFVALCHHDWVAEINHRTSNTSIRDPRFISWDFLYNGRQKTFMDIYFPNYTLPSKNYHQYRDVLLCSIYILQNHKDKISAADELQLRDYARRVVSLTDTGVQNRWCAILFLKVIIELIHN